MNKPINYLGVPDSMLTPYGKEQAEKQRAALSKGPLSVKEGHTKARLADVALALSYYTSKRDGELNNHERVIIAALSELPELRSIVGDHEMMCGSVMAEIRKLCNEIMGGNCAFIDDDFGRCLVTMRDQRDSLTARLATVEMERDAMREALRTMLHFLDEWHREFPEGVGDKEAPAIDAALALLSPSSEAGKGE